MIQGAWTTAVITIATADTLSAECDLGRDYETLLIIMPTLTSAQVSFMGSRTTGGTFYDIYVTDPADGGNNKVICDAFTTGTFAWIVPIGGYRYIKVKTSAAQAANRTFQVCGVRR